MSLKVKHLTFSRLFLAAKRTLGYKLSLTIFMAVAETRKDAWLEFYDVASGVRNLRTDRSCWSSKIHGMLLLQK